MRGAGFDRPRCPKRGENRRTGPTASQRQERTLESDQAGLGPPTVLARQTGPAWSGLIGWELNLNTSLWISCNSAERKAYIPLLFSWCTRTVGTTTDTGPRNSGTRV
jgi:hypothetical protein